MDAVGFSALAKLDDNHDGFLSREEFTTHLSSFYRPPVAADATRWDDEPLEIEI